MVDKSKSLKKSKNNANIVEVIGDVISLQKGRTELSRGSVLSW